MLRHFDTQAPSHSDRAEVAVRLLSEFRHLRASTIVRAVSECDRLLPAEPASVIEHAARERLRSTA